jgi:hypothetical protein
VSNRHRRGEALPGPLGGATRTSDDRDRAALVRAAAESWGEEAAATLSELLPRSGDRPATKRDIDGVLAAMNAMDDRYEARFAQMQTRTLVFSQLAALVVIAALAFGLR